MNIFLLLLLCLIATSLASYQPGVELQVSQRGINEGVRLGTQWIEENMKKLSIPNESGKNGILHYELTSFKVTQFSLNSVGLQLREPDVMDLKATGVWVEMTAHYKIWVQIGWFKLGKSGGMWAKMKNANVYSAFELATAGDGHPELKAASVLVTISPYIGDFLVVFYGGILDFILDLLIFVISAFLSPVVDLAISLAVRNMLLTYVNPQLAKIPLDIEFPGPAQGFHIDYHLTSSPFVKGSSITVPFRGKFWYHNHQNDPQIPTANGVIHPLNANEMVCFVLDGDEVFGSAAYALQVSPLSKFDTGIITLIEEQEKIKNFLKCSCTDGQCIGALIPAIQRNCLSSGTVTVEVEITSTASFHFNATGAFVETSFTSHIMTASADGETLKDLFDVVADVGLLFKNNLRIEDWTIKQNVTMTHTNLTLESANPSIGGISMPILEKIWEAVIKLIINSGLNAVTSRGIPLPPIPDAKLINPRFVFDSYTFALCSDVQATLPH